MPPSSIWRASFLTYVAHWHKKSPYYFPRFAAHARIGSTFNVTAPAFIDFNPNLQWRKKCET